MLSEATMGTKVRGAKVPMRATLFVKNFENKPFSKFKN
jgi:hypothetical protein